MTRDTRTGPSLICLTRGDRLLRSLDETEEESLFPISVGDLWSGGLQAVWGPPFINDFFWEQSVEGTDGAAACV